MLRQFFRRNPQTKALLYRMPAVQFGIKGQRRSHSTNAKRGFHPNANVQSEQIYRCLHFAWAMTYGQQGAHRPLRSGGRQVRQPRRQFQDIFIGKIGEAAFYNSACQQGIAAISPVDYCAEARGQWDDADLSLTAPAGQNTCHITVKTTQHYGTLCLLECADWAVKRSKAIYLPNRSKPSAGYYAYLIFCRAKSNLPSLLTRLAETEPAAVEAMPAAQLPALQARLHLEIEIVGIVPNTHIAQAICGGYIVRRGDLLNGSKPLDADNYYLHIDSFPPINHDSFAALTC